MINIFFFISGLCFGSFGNVIICRFLSGEGLTGRSHCPSCKRTLRAWELVPLFSFLLLRGHCATCKATISWQYPSVEIASGLLFAFAFYFTFAVPSAILMGLALWILLLIAILDALTRGIPDILNVPLIVVSVAYSVLQDVNPLSGMFLGAGFFAVQWFMSRGRWVGSGDILLGAGIGALLGTWQMVLIQLFFAYIIGAVFAGVLLITGKATRKSHLAFGPFLIIGALIALMMGERILAVI